MKPTWTRRAAVVIACITPGLLFACSSNRPSSGAFIEGNGSASSSSASSGTLSSSNTVCDGDLTLCSDGCTDTRTNPKHCGQCNKACAATERCEDSACVALVCAPGTVPCSNECKDTTTDLANCGSCGHACEGSERCTKGTCSLTCPAGAVTCKGKCIEPNADGAHCGATAGCGESGGSPGVVCGASASCFGGQCVSECGDGLDACPSGCVDFRSDDANCGGCGTLCGSGRHCSYRVCCLAGEIACMGVCRDPSTDPSACGGCGTVCPDGESCVNGACTP